MEWSVWRTRYSLKEITSIFFFLQFSLQKWIFSCRLSLEIIENGIRNCHCSQTQAEAFRFNWKRNESADFGFGSATIIRFTGNESENKSQTEFALIACRNLVHSFRSTCPLFGTQTLRFSLKTDSDKCNLSSDKHGLSGLQRTKSISKSRKRTAEYRANGRGAVCCSFRSSCINVEFCMLMRRNRTGKIQSRTESCNECVCVCFFCSANESLSARALILPHNEVAAPFPLARNTLAFFVLCLCSPLVSYRSRASDRQT